MWAPRLRVNFDLDGTGRVQSYFWLRLESALLVWDPQHTGHITSGRQLFGNVTWWMFWENGYQALAALDGDHDGWLRGREFAGLALWFDRNQNGVSDPSGVDSPMNANGVKVKDGRILPTWDWVTVAPPVPPVSRPVSAVEQWAPFGHRPVFPAPLQ